MYAVKNVLADSLEVAEYSHPFKINLHLLSKCWISMTESLSVSHSKFYCKMKPGATVVHFACTKLRLAVHLQDECQIIA